METKPIRKVIAQNLTELRKKKGLTQYELAQKFAYSDKAVSKWECGDTLPDLETLMALAEFYGVTLDYFVHSTHGKEDLARKECPHLNHTVISVLCGTIPALVSAIVYFVLFAAVPTNFWMAWVWFVPVDFLLFFIFSWIWKKPVIRSINGIWLVWTLLAALYLQLGTTLANGWAYWPIFFIGIPLTIALLLWLRVRKTNKKESKDMTKKGEAD